MTQENLKVKAFGDLTKLNNAEYLRFMRENKYKIMTNSVRYLKATAIVPFL